MENIELKLWKILKDKKDPMIIKLTNDTETEMRKKVSGNMFFKINDQIRNQIISSVQYQIKKEL
jgi:hypothetical protein